MTSIVPLKSFQPVEFLSYFCKIKSKILRSSILSSTKWLYKCFQQQAWKQYLHIKIVNIFKVSKKKNYNIQDAEPYHWLIWLFSVRVEAAIQKLSTDMCGT